MGGTGDGVEVRDTSIRIKFVLEPGQPAVKRTLMDDRGRPLPPTPGNIRHAHRVAKQIREAIRQRTFSMSEFFPQDGAPAGPMTVGRHLDTWLGTQRVEASTLAGYESAARFWKTAQFSADRPGSAFGDLQLRGVRTTDVLTVLALRKELSGKTINNYVSVLRKALDLAVIDGALAANPVAAVERAKWQKDPPDPFSREEVEAICADAAKHHPGQVANLIEWWLFTGVRTSEAFGLRWQNVDLASGHVRIMEAMVRGEHKSTTKTAVARDILLNSRAAAALTRQRPHSQLASTGHVWLDPRYGTPWTEERAFRRSFWTPLLKRLGIRYRRPYNMRHSYATMLLMADNNPAWCAGQMGHSVQMFLSTYAKWINGDQDASELAGLERWIRASPAAAGGT